MACTALARSAGVCLIMHACIISTYHAPAGQANNRLWAYACVSDQIRGDPPPAYALKPGGRASGPIRRMGRICVAESHDGCPPAGEHGETAGRDEGPTAPPQPTQPPAPAGGSRGSTYICWIRSVVCFNLMLHIHDRSMPQLHYACLVL